MSAQGQDGRSDAATRRIVGVVSAVVAACLLLVGLAQTGATQAAWHDEAKVTLPAVTVADGVETSELTCRGHYRGVYVVAWESTDERRWSVTARQHGTHVNVVVVDGRHHRYWAVVSTSDRQSILVTGKADGKADIQLRLTGGCPDWRWRAGVRTAHDTSADGIPTRVHEVMEAYRAELEAAEAPAEEEQALEGGDADAEGDDAESGDDVVQPEPAAGDLPETPADAPTEDAAPTVLPPAQEQDATDGVVDDQPLVDEGAA